ncbi:LysR substrate-binding domain-containing protein [Streptomyces leeuwenhoekii]|uniref:LysR family transcriptional regulator n=1 Tax=Streptomyces leeuwenhoekii TaxID=1437453 RepID=UPI0036CCBF1E
MDVKQLRALVTVAEVGSVTRAAALLHLVQPAVTRQIRALEHELGVALFERTRQGMLPTEAGVIMADRARRALGELERGRSEVRPAAGAVTGTVTVGLLDSASDLLAGPLASRLALSHPGVELRLVTAYSGHLRQWFDEGRLDLSLLYDLHGTASLTTRPLVSERLWAVAPPTERLPSGHPVPFAELARHPLVLPMPGHALRSLIDTAAARAGVSLTVAVQSDSMRVQKHLVLAGHGWTVLPGVGVTRDIADQKLRAAPLCRPVVRRSVVLATPGPTRTTPAADAVAKALVSAVTTSVRQGDWPSAPVRGG